MFVSAAPLNVIWNYTYACNFNCTHCYSRAPKYPSELKTPEYKSIAKQIIDIGALKVVFGGGEVLLRRDFIEVLNLLSSNGVQSAVTTNGWAVDAKIIENLKNSGLSELYVSIDSSDSETHDLIRGQKNSHTRAIETTRAAAQAGIKTYFSSVLTKHSAQQVLEISKIAHEIGANGVNFKRFRAAGNGLNHKDELALDDESYKSVEYQIKIAKELYPDSAISLNFGAEANEFDNGCSCGTTAITIRPNGDISPCSYSEDVIGNIHSESLLKIWNESAWLNEKRRVGSCSALKDQPLPSNPQRIRMIKIQQHTA